MSRLQLTSTKRDTVPKPMVLHARVVSGAGGGPDKTILRSAQYADDMGLRMAALYIHPEGDDGIDVIRKHANTFNCPLYEISENGPLDPWAVRAALQLCRKLRVTVWHAHDYKTDAMGLLLRRLWPMKLITTVHGFTRETPRTRLYYHVDNWCLPRYDQVITVSPPLYQHCLAKGVSKERLLYVPNGIEMDEYQREHTIEEARHELGVWTDRLVIGCVGRLSPEKGVDRAIRSVAMLRDDYPNVELHLVGDGPELATLRTMADELGVDDITHFWGWQSNTKRFFEMMDVLLLPSHTEGLPNAVLEGMAMHVPVAATDVGGVRDLLDDGKCGVVLSNDVADWPSEIAPLLVSRARREMLAEQAHERVSEQFSFRKRMSRVWRVYNRELQIRTADRKALDRRAA